MVKVDAHVHVFDRVSDAFPREVSGLAPAERTATVEDLLHEMDAAGVARAVLIQMGGVKPEHHRYVAKAVQRWPDRFVAAGLVDLADTDPASRLDELVQTTGIVGIRLMGALGRADTVRVEDLTGYAAFRCASQLGLNVNLYCRGDQIANIGMLVHAFPDVVVSLDHLGICPLTSFVADQWRRPRFEDEPIPPATYSQITDLARYPNVYVKVSGEYAFSRRSYPYGDLRPMVESIYRAYGARRMMWCSDSPWIREEPGYQMQLALLDIHLPLLDETEKMLIAGGNANKVWFGR